jgi:hypothetical protein
MNSGRKMVKRRAVFFIGGFDPKSATAFFTRMDRENTRFEKLWNASISRQDAVIASDVTSCHRFDARDDSGQSSWSTLTDFHYVSLDDIVLSDFSMPMHRRLYRYFNTFWDYVLSGTAFRFFRHAWRFAIYFVYPAVMLCLTLLVSIWLSGLVGSDGSMALWVLKVAIFLAVFWGVYQVVLKRYKVPHLTDLWSFSREYLHNRRPDMNDKLDRLADQIHAAAASEDYDEVLTIGHSTGGALILDANGRALARHPDFADVAHRVTILTAGSTALKVGLHPAAKWYRDKLHRLFSTTNINWLEFQCLTDIINFYKTNPAHLMGLNDTMRKPMQIFTIRIKNMVAPEIYKRIKLNYFRVHYQFVYGNTVKQLYDFPAICFGPATLVQRMIGDAEENEPNAFLDNLTGSRPESS